MLITASLQFPTVVFTIALGIALVYWVFVLLGALDIDLLGGGDVSGAAKGIGEVVGGHADVGTGGEGHGHHGGDGDADGGGVWSALGLGDVPMTITVSLILLLCWSGSLLGMHYVSGSIPWLKWLIVPMLVLVALPITAVLIRPIAPVFKVREGKSNTDYVGHHCTVTTGHVDDEFGQANIEDGATVLIIAVRCDRPGKLKRGDKALVIEFDPARQAYLVEPVTD